MSFGKFIIHRFVTQLAGLGDKISVYLTHSLDSRIAGRQSRYLSLKYLSPAADSLEIGLLVVSLGT